MRAKDARGADVTARLEPDKAERGPDTGRLTDGAGQQVLDLDGDFIAADDHGPFRHRHIVGEDTDLVVLRGVELDDGAAAEPKHLVDRHGAGAQHHRDIDRDGIKCRHCSPLFRLCRYRVYVGYVSPRYGYEGVNTRGDETIGLLPSDGVLPVEWEASDRPVAYDAALAAMTARAEAIARGQAGELVWLLQHPPLYTAGTSARPSELIEARFPVHAVGRGGQFTYHGPGQRVGYVMLDLKRRAPDVRRFVATIEEWLIQALAAFNVRGERRDDRVGVWVRRPDKGEGFEDKIAAIGIRVRQWVTLHGFSLNVEPELSHFSGIVPCGVADARYGVTSLADLGITATMPEVDMALRAAFEPLFGKTVQKVESTENNSSRRRSATSAAPASR
jgi:lipoyl(octanoyl) transferase